MFGFDDTGFGSVFEGFDGGNLTNVSTQVVLDLLKNASCGEQEGLVGISTQDIQEFHIPRSVQDPNNGKLILSIFKMDVVASCVVFVVI
jgi:hypothetical protein